MYWESIGETNYYFTLKYKLLLYILEDDLVERKFLIRKIKWIFVDWICLIRYELILNEKMMFSTGNQ